MSHAVSFYVTRPASDEEGRRATFWHRLGSRSWIGAFSVDGLAPGLVRMIRDGDAREAHDRLWEAVEESGGVFVKLREEAGADEIEIFQAAGTGFEPPARALLLRWGRPAEVVPIPWGEILRIEPGDHFLVPVEAIAEAGLRRFHSSLGGFPPDAQATLLEVLRRPAIEARVSHLERSLQEIAEQQSAQGPQSMRQPVVFSAAAVIGLVAGLLLAGAGFLLPWRSALPGLSTPSEKAPIAQVESVASAQTESTPEAASAGGVPAGTEDQTVEPGPSQSDATPPAWLTAWRDYTAAMAEASGPRLSALAATHFEGETADGPRGASAFWATVKTGLLADGRSLRIQVYSDTEYWSPGWTGILRDLRSNRERSRALAALGCPTYGFAGMNVHPDRGEPSERWILAEDLDCESIPQEDLDRLEAELRRLEAFVGSDGTG